MDNCGISEIVENPSENQGVTVEKTEETVEFRMNSDEKILIEGRVITDETTEETAESPVSLEKKSLMRKDSGLKSITPVQRLQLPKASNFSDRCMSPTDQLISPVSRRLLSRNRKGSGLRAPPKNLSTEVGSN